MTLSLATEDDARMRAHLSRAYPEEGCGVLLGTEQEGARRIVEIATLDNHRTGDRSRRFLISPEQFLAVEKRARERGIEVLGFFHSHPDHPAEPSAFDLEHAWPYYSYLIVSVRDGEPGEATAWRLAEDRTRFVPETLIVPGMGGSR